MASLFVYGTLHPDRAPAEIRDVTNRFVLIGSGTVMGCLLDLEEYPGLVLNGLLEPVQGNVYEVPQDALADLDAYEDYDPNDPDRSLFIRQMATVTMSDGHTEEHWTYLFQGAGSVPL